MDQVKEDDNDESDGSRSHSISSSSDYTWGYEVWSTDTMFDVPTEILDGDEQQPSPQASTKTTKKKKSVKKVKPTQKIILVPVKRKRRKKTEERDTKTDKKQNLFSRTVSKMAKTVGLKKSHTHSKSGPETPNKSSRSKSDKDLPRTAKPKSKKKQNTRKSSPSVESPVATNKQKPKKISGTHKKPVPLASAQQQNSRISKKSTKKKKKSM